MDFLEKHPITNGDEWVAKLMAHNEMLGGWQGQLWQKVVAAVH